MTRDNRHITERCGTHWGRAIANPHIVGALLARLSWETIAFRRNRWP